MAIGDLAQLRYRWACGSTRYEMTWGFKALTAATTWRQQLADEWGALVHPTICAALVTSASRLETVVEDVVPGTGAPGLESSALPGGGLVAGDNLPLQCAAVISWRSSLPGRANRGRTYFSGMPLASLDAQGEDWESVQFNRLRAIRDKIMQVYSRTTGTSSIAFLVVISRQENGVPRGPIGVQVDSGRVDGSVRSMRKRAVS